MIFKASIEHQIKRTNLKLVFNFSNDIVQNQMRTLNNKKIGWLTVCRCSTICHVSLREFKQKAYVTFFRRVYVLRYDQHRLDLGYDQNGLGSAAMMVVWLLRYKVWNVLWNWLHFKPNYICTHIALCAKCFFYNLLTIWYIVKCVFN